MSNLFKKIFLFAAAIILLSILSHSVSFGQSMTYAGAPNELNTRQGGFQTVRFQRFPFSFAPYATYSSTGMFWFDSTTTGNLWYYWHSQPHQIVDKNYVDSIVSVGGGVTGARLRDSCDSIRAALLDSCFAIRQSSTGTVTSITATAPLTGGVITTSGSIGLNTVGTAGTYGNSTQIPVITTDAWGRVISVTPTTVSAVQAVLPGYGIQASGSPSVTVTYDSATVNPQILGTLVGGTGINIVGRTIINTSPSSGGTVTSVSGTANRITSTGGTSPIMDIAATYVGQSSITTLGTIAAGAWNGSSISTTYTDAKIKTVTGTSNRLTIGGTSTDPTFDISTAYVGQNTITTVGNVGIGAWQGTKVGLAYGGTNADLSATGGASQYLKQASSGAAITVGTIPAADLPSIALTGDVTGAASGGSIATTAAGSIVKTVSMTTPNVIFASPVTFTTSSNTASGTLSLNSQSAYTIFGNNTAGSATPTFFTPTLASALFQNQGTTTTVLHGNASGNPAWGPVVNSDITDGTIDLTAKVVGVLPVANGGTNKSSVTTAPAVSSWMGWDANKNATANALIGGFTSVVTGSATITYSVSTAAQTQYTGTLNQTVVLPDVTTLATISTGYTQQFQVVNNSTGTVTVNSFGGNLIQTITAGNKCLFTCISNTGTTAASWNPTLVVLNGGVSSVSGSSTITSSPTTGAVVLSIPSSVPLAGNPTTTTQTGGDNSTRIATTAYVDVNFDSVSAASYTGTLTITSTVAGVKRPVFYIITAQAGALFLAAPTGNWSDFQLLEVIITDNGTARALTYNAAFQSTSNATLPTTTVISTRISLLFQYDSRTAKYYLVSVT